MTDGDHRPKDTFKSSIPQPCARICSALSLLNVGMSAESPTSLLLQNMFLSTDDLATIDVGCRL